jgi:hypothetical protein
VILRARLLPGNDETKWFSLAVAAAVILSVLILNEKEIWAIVRFGRLLAVPLAMLYGTAVVRALKTNSALFYGLGLILGIMVFSQFAFAYYMTKIWVPYF